jgi:hypothetical protein
VSRFTSHREQERAEYGVALERCRSHLAIRTRRQLFHFAACSHWRRPGHLRLLVQADVALCFGVVRAHVRVARGSGQQHHPNRQVPRVVVEGRQKRVLDLRFVHSEMPSQLACELFPARLQLPVDLWQHPVLEPGEQFAASDTLWLFSFLGLHASNQITLPL